MHRIARRKGIGDILADGAKITAEKFGNGAILVPTVAFRFAWVRSDTAADSREGIKVGNFPPSEFQGLIVGSPVSFSLSYRGDPAPDIGFIRAV